MTHRCRVCGGALARVLDLGRTPLANGLLPPDAPLEQEARYPLALARCPDCSTVQIEETVDPHALFSEYLYFSSTSDAMVAHCRRAAEHHIDHLGLGADSLVAEIASNDGYFLQSFKAHGIPVLGVEPASNIAAVAADRGIETVCAFFDEALATRLVEEGRRADLLLANNVMAHIPDVVDAVRGAARLLAPGGLFVTESPYLLDLVDQLEFDTIYHEHVYYYSLTSWAEVLRRGGLEVVDVEHVPIHGGSLRVCAAHPGARPVTSRVAETLAREAAWGVSHPEVFDRFASRVASLREALREALLSLRREGASVAAYGASAKGTTLLSALGDAADSIAFVVDRSPHKQGLLTPGTHLPIRAPEALLDAAPDVVLLLVWNFAEEILAQQAAYRRAGGRFLIPVPSPHFA